MHTTKWCLGQHQDETVWAHVLVVEYVVEAGGGVGAGGGCGGGRGGRRKVVVLEEVGVQVGLEHTWWR